MLAAKKRAWNACEYLLQQGQDWRKKDAKGRNILHLIIMNGGNLENVSQCMCNKVSWVFHVATRHFNVLLQDILKCTVDASCCISSVQGFAKSVEHS